MNLRLPSGNRADHDERLCARDYGLRQGRIRRIVRQIFFTSEKSQKRPPLQRDVIADRPLQHGIVGFQRIENRARRDWARNFKLDVAINMRQRSQMRRNDDSDHA